MAAQMVLLAYFVPSSPLQSDKGVQTTNISAELHLVNILEDISPLVPSVYSWVLSIASHTNDLYVKIYIEQLQKDLCCRVYAYWIYIYITIYIMQLDSVEFRISP